MKKFLNNIKNEAKHIRMSAAEKSAMKADIFGTVSPLPTAPSPYFFFSYHYRMALAGLLLFVLAGAGTASAAQGALPGDLLYPVKIHINEQVEVALATTPAQKAKAETHLAERRVEEAQTLAAQGRLNATTTREIEDNFNEHASRALAFSAEEHSAAALATNIKTAEPKAQTEGNHAPRATMLQVPTKAASVTPEATSSGEGQSAATSTQESKDAEDIPASIEEQKNILKDLKLHVEGREHSTRDIKTELQIER